MLLDDNFASILRAVRLGRRIFDNLRKSMSYILAVHVPIAGMALLPVLLGWPVALFPLHIAFLELVIDPACSMVFENEPTERDVMQRAPRDVSAALFGGMTLIFSNRSRSGSLWAGLRVPNRALWIVTGLTLALLVLVLYVPSLARLFFFEPLALPDLLTALALGLASVLWFEVVKLSRRPARWRPR